MRLGEVAEKAKPQKTPGHTAPVTPVDRPAAVRPPLRGRRKIPTTSAGGMGRRLLLRISRRPPRATRGPVSRQKWQPTTRDFCAPVSSVSSVFSVVLCVLCVFCVFCGGFRWFPAPKYITAAQTQTTIAPARVPCSFPRRCASVCGSRPRGSTAWLTATRRPRHGRPRRPHRQRSPHSSSVCFGSSTRNGGG